MRRAPRRRRGDLHRAVSLVTDPTALDGDRAEARLEREGARPPPLDALTPFAVTTLQDQLAIGLLDERPEEPPLDLQTGGMDGRLDRVGEALVLIGHRQGDHQLQRGREILAHPVDRAKSDGSLKVVGLTHGESPSWFYGGSSCVFCRISPTMSPSWGKFAPENRLPSLRISPLVAHQLASAYKFFPSARQLVRASRASSSLPYRVGQRSLGQHTRPPPSVEFVVLPRGF